VIDANGRVVPNAEFPLQFSIGGNGEIAATGNANPSGMASMQQPQHKTFRGKCLVIVRPKGSGSITLKAIATGLTSAQIVISTKQ